MQHYLRNGKFRLAFSLIENGSEGRRVEKERWAEEVVNLFYLYALHLVGTIWIDNVLDISYLSGWLRGLWVGSSSWRAAINLWSLSKKYFWTSIVYHGLDLLIKVWKGIFEFSRFKANKKPVKIIRYYLFFIIIWLH